MLIVTAQILLAAHLLCPDEPKHDRGVLPSLDRCLNLPIELGVSGPNTPEEVDRMSDVAWTRRRRAGMRQVAELANVAISSVSRVLSHHPDVSPEMRARVLEAVRQLEYEPDFLAQSLRREIGRASCRERV